MSTAFCVIIHSSDPQNKHLANIKALAMDVVNSDPINNMCVVNTISEDQSASTYAMALSVFDQVDKVPTHVISIEGNSVRISDLNLLMPREVEFS